MDHMIKAKDTEVSSIQFKIDSKDKQRPKHLSDWEHPWPTIAEYNGGVLTKASLFVKVEITE